MDRVLALPDLAGLHNKSRKRLTIPDSPFQRKKQASKLTSFHDKLTL